MQVHTPSREELLDRRRRLLEQAGTSRDELDRRAGRGDLVGDEYRLWEELRSIDFLLADGQ